LIEQEFLPSMESQKRDELLDNWKKAKNRSKNWIEN
jgi:glycerol kinase